MSDETRAPGAAAIQMSQMFLQGDAAKHFVYLSYRITRNGAPLGEGRDFASCFVVETGRIWLLMTAGHNITKIRDYKAKGVVVDDFNLHDKLAGNLHPFSLPYAFHLDDWIVRDEKPAGADYAAAPLYDLIVQGLSSGNVRPITEIAWGGEPFDQYPAWLLVGIPIESMEVVNGKTVLKLTLMPIARTPPPAGAAKVTPGSRIYARLISQPGLDSVQITDIDGMSGGPIFGVKVIDGRLHYWLIGLQIAWHRSERIVSFCPALPFLRRIKEAVRRATEASGPSPIC